MHTPPLLWLALQQYAMLNLLSQCRHGRNGRTTPNHVDPQSGVHFERMLPQTPAARRAAPAGERHVRHRKSAKNPPTQGRRTAKYSLLCTSFFFRLSLSWSMGVPVHLHGYAFQLPPSTAPETPAKRSNPEHIPEEPRPGAPTARETPRPPTMLRKKNGNPRGAFPNFTTPRRL